MLVKKKMQKNAEKSPIEKVQSLLDHRNDEAAGVSIIDVLHQILNSPL